jgi:hypothetical protein
MAFSYERATRVRSEDLVISDAKWFNDEMVDGFESVDSLDIYLKECIH